MHKPVWPLLLLFISPVMAPGQNTTDTCILDVAKDGQTIAVRGKAVQLPHDLGLDIRGCTDLVVLTFAGEYSDNRVSADQLRRDHNLRQFNKYVSSIYKSDGKNICMQCSKYADVEATLIGKLQIATIPPGTTKDPFGFLHDATGKIIGTSGFGHPSRSYRYQLVILSIADVKARKLPRPF
jgi:hypothetical protein